MRKGFIVKSQVLFEQMRNILCPSIYANFSMSFNFVSFLGKYLPSSVTPIIFSQKQQCLEPRPVEIQVLVKRFLYSFYIHIETLIRLEYL